MRRLHLHRPSAATIISLFALFFAMSGTAVAATGGTFILGSANTDTRVSSLANTAGTALSLSSTSTTPPLIVSNSVQVPRLNASQLGGIPASGYMQGGGHITGAQLTIKGTDTNAGVLLRGPKGIILVAVCGATGTALDLSTPSSPGPSAPSLFPGRLVWWGPSGVGSNFRLGWGGATEVTPLTTTPYEVVVQLVTHTSISTFTATEWFNASTTTCNFAGQMVTTNG